jgi:hypothetical protein
MRCRGFAFAGFKSSQGGTVALSVRCTINRQASLAFDTVKKDAIFLK